MLLKKVANLAKGSAEPNRNKVGTVTAKQVEDIAKHEDARPELPDPRVGDQDGARDGAVDGNRRRRLTPSKIAQLRIAQFQLAVSGLQIGSWELSVGGPERPDSTTRRNMAKHGKKFTAARGAGRSDRPYSIEEAIPLIQKVKFAKFDETVELAMRLGVDPKHADQMVRGTVVLPHGLGKSKRVLAIAGAEKQKEAQEAGADIVGGEEMVEKIRAAGWTSTRSSRRPT